MRDVELQLSRRGTHFRYIVDVRAHGDTHAALVHAAKRSETMRLDCSLCRNERWREPQLDILGNHIIGTVKQRRHDPDAGITHPGYRIVVAVDHVLDGIDAGVHAHSQPCGMKTVHRDRLAECMRFIDDRIELLLGHIAHVWAGPERNPAGDAGLDSVGAAADEFAHLAPQLPGSVGSEILGPRHGARKREHFQMAAGDDGFGKYQQARPRYNTGIDGIANRAHLFGEVAAWRAPGSITHSTEPHFEVKLGVQKRIERLQLRSDSKAGYSCVAERGTVEGAQMNMGIDQARHQGAVLRIDDGSAGRHLDGAPHSDLANARIVDDDQRINYDPAGTIDQPLPGDCAD